MQAKIDELEAKISNLKDKSTILSSVTKELDIVFPEISKISFGDILTQTSSLIAPSKKYTVFVKWQPSATEATKSKFRVFTKLRLGVEDIEIVDL